MNNAILAQSPDPRLRRALVRGLRVVALVAVALLTGLAFAHLLEQPAKLHYDPTLYLTLQKTLYAAWGTPHLGGWIEPAAIVATLALAFATRDDRPAFSLALAAAGALLLAFPVVYFLFIEPANAVFRATTTVPEHFQLLRSRWEAGHALRFLLQFAALCLLAISVVREPPRDADEFWPA
jgi:hypothetical protein